MPQRQVNQKQGVKPKGKKSIFLLQFLESAADGVFLVGSAAIILGIALTFVGITVVASPLIYLAAFAGIAICGAGAFYIRRSIEKDRQKNLADEINNQLTKLDELFIELEEVKKTNKATPSKKAEANKARLIESLAEKLTAPMQEDIKEPVGIKKFFRVLFNGRYQKKLQAAQKKQEDNKQLITSFLQRYSNAPLNERSKKAKAQLIENIAESITKNKKDIFTNRPSNKAEKTTAIIYTGIGDGRSIFTGVRDSVQIMATLQVILIGVGVTLGFIATGPVGAGALLLGGILGSSIFFTLRNEKKQNTKLEQIKEETQIIKDALADYRIVELEREHARDNKKLNQKVSHVEREKTHIEGKLVEKSDQLILAETENQKLEWELERVREDSKAKIAEKDDEIARKEEEIKALKLQILSNSDEENKENKENQNNLPNKADNRDLSKTNKNNKTQLQSNLFHSNEALFFNKVLKRNSIGSPPVHGQRSYPAKKC